MQNSWGRGLGGVAIGNNVKLGKKAGIGSKIGKKLEFGLGWV